MTRFVMAAGFALALISLAAAQDKKQPAKNEPAKKDALKLSKEEQAVIDLTNAERKKEGLPPLKAEAHLMAAARGHAENMAKQDKLDHVLDGKTHADRTKAAGYKSGFVGENIAWNQQTPKEVLETWMKSQPHKENILRKEFTQIGVGIAKNEKGEPYWVQVFAAPLK